MKQKLVFLSQIFFWNLVLLSFPVLGQSIHLPTPKAFYDTYDPKLEGLRLYSEIAAGLEPGKRMWLMAQLASIQSGKMGDLSDAELRQLLDTIKWRQHREEFLRLMVYQSGVLEVVSDESKQWRPLINDFLLFFLDHLQQDRLIERIVSQIRLAGIEDRGKRTLALIERTPSLQKIGQILARYPGVPLRLRRSLQQLENSIRTTRRDDLIQFIEEDIGEERLQEYQVKFDPEILAEATIGAVIGARLSLPGEDRSRHTACKVVKPYAVMALKEELKILDGLVRFFEVHGDFYDLGQIPLSDMFQEVKDALSKEIQVVEEQKNLVRAFEYYRDDPRVKVPQIYSISTNNTTCMEFIEGQKIVDAFPHDKKARSKLAARLNRVMTMDVIFSRKDEALFHGDPHAGNVFHMEDSRDPYRIALLDWGLQGSLSRSDRQELIQLMLGIYLRNEKRIRNHVVVLLEDKGPRPPDEIAKLQAAAVQGLRNSTSKSTFDILSDIVVQLTKAGFRLDFNFVLFIKAQLTIRGVIHELDPKLKRDAKFSRSVSGQIFKELPRRFINTVYFPGWTSHGYPSMVSNEDIRDVTNKKLGTGFKKLGGWVWTGISYPFRGHCKVPEESVPAEGVSEPVSELAPSKDRR